MAILWSMATRKHCSPILKKRKQKTTFPADSDRRKKMRRTFQDELEELHIRFYKMGQMVHEAVHQSVQAFSEQDEELATKGIANDAKINELEETLEKECIELIALQQPVSSDLRKIITVMKASADLERMGDHAVSISKATVRTVGQPKQPEVQEK